MKRFSILPVMMCCLLINACGNTSVGVIGGADGPTNIYVKSQFGKQYEKKPVRMFNVDGDLYYDSGLVSDETPRCGTMDGELKKTVKENEIPFESGEANFEASGYQHATDITKEVNIDGKWLIFKKYDTLGKSIDGLKYCYYIKGHLNNAATDSEIIVLSEDENVTFNDVYEPLFSSQSTVREGTGRNIHNNISSEKWGITLHPDNVTSTGMILKIEQFGGSSFGDFETSAAYSLEMIVDDEWQPVETKTGETPVWALIGYKIKKNDITEMKIDWENTYGNLQPGFYRLNKEITDCIASGHFEKKLYNVYFTIE